MSGQPLILAGFEMNIAKPVIRRASEFDAPSLARLAKQAFQDAFAQMNNEKDFETYVAQAFKENQIKSELLDSTAAFFIAEIKDQWAGYAKLYQSPPPDCIKQLPAIELSRLYCLGQYLGCGIGSALLDACINHAKSNAFKSIWLGSWKKNLKANAFYTKMQFEIAGTKTFVVGSDIQDDYVFVKPIK